MRKKFEDVLIINSYAGSLTVAADWLGLNILASMEDAGYALGTQKLNFPNLTYVDHLPWPDPGYSLENTVVIAHPPCAAFSNQSSNFKSLDNNKRGVTSKHFDCTRRVIDYAGMNCAAALLIESVRGALEGAREFYDTYPQRYDFDVYRILQNACTFEVPQWRPRYWTVMIRRGMLPHDILNIRHTRNYSSLAEALDGDYDNCEKNAYTEKYWQIMKDKLVKSGLYYSQIEELATGEWGFGPIDRTLGKVFDLDEIDTRKRFNISGFDSHVFNVLDPRGVSPAVMCGYNWLWKGRPINVPELNIIAGFPPHYQFDKQREQKCYLSKGVAPPVAAWLLNEVQQNLLGNTSLNGGFREHVWLLKPGETADLQVTRDQVKQREFNG